jgi:hypothetical protein
MLGLPDQFCQNSVILSIFRLHSAAVLARTCHHKPDSSSQSGASAHLAIRNLRLSQLRLEEL